jgi:Spy/CpxP family protein refolding chaperone
MKDLGAQIKTQEGSSTMDQSVVNGLVDKKATLIGDMMKAKVQAKHEIMGMLNPQQRMMIQNKMEKMEKRIAARYKSCHDDE